MKIAVTYCDGEVFQHFGHTETFKLYEAEEDKIVRSEVVSSEGAGHGALAGFLRAKGADVLICGGIGGGAVAALAAAGIKVYAGASGSADGCVAALLAGTLTLSSDANCSHHGHGGHDCGHGGHEDCGHGGHEDCGHGGCGR